MHAERSMKSNVCSYTIIMLDHTKVILFDKQCWIVWGFTLGMELGFWCYIVETDWIAIEKVIDKIYWIGISFEVLFVIVNFIELRLILIYWIAINFGVVLLDGPPQ